MGKIIFKHYCKKWKKGNPKPKLINDKTGKMICSCCKQSVGGKITFDGTEKVN